MTETQLTSDWKCAACGKSSSYQGHLMKDPETDEFFMSCQEPERRKKVLDLWMEAWK